MDPKITQSHVESWLPNLMYHSGPKGSTIVHEYQKFGPAQNIFGPVKGQGIRLMSIILRPSYYDNNYRNQNFWIVAGDLQSRQVSSSVKRQVIRLIENRNSLYMFFECLICFTLTQACTHSMSRVILNKAENHPRMVVFSKDIHIQGVQTQYDILWTLIRIPLDKLLTRLWCLLGSLDADIWPNQIFFSKIQPSWPLRPQKGK